MVGVMVKPSVGEGGFLDWGYAAEYAARVMDDLDRRAVTAAPKAALVPVVSPPPHCNTVVESASDRGIDRSSSNPSVECMIDYWRVRYFLSVPDVMALYGGQDWVPLDRGRWGYRTGWRRGDLFIYADGHSASMGVLVEAGGQGCRQLEAELGFASWEGFIAEQVAAGGWFRRMDVALDERDGVLKMEEMWQAVLRRDVATRCKRAHRVEGVDLTGSSDEGSVQGSTITFGKRVSEAYFRIYDKRAEQLEKGKEVPEGPWVRVEGEFHDDRAQELAELLSTEGLPSFSRVVKGFIDFKVRGTCQQRCRWETAPFWSEFLGVVEGLKIKLAPKKRSLDAARAWVERSVAGTLAALVKEDGGLSWLLRTLGDGASKIAGEQRSVLGGLFGEGSAQVGHRKLKVEWSFGSQQSWDVCWV